MASTTCLPEDHVPIGAMKPAADAAGRSGRYVSMRMMQKLLAVVYLDQGNAATVALTVTQAQDVGGTNAKPLTTPLRVWALQDVAAGGPVARQADASSFTTDAAVKEKIILLEIPVEALDMNNGFKAVRVNTGASHAANITSVLYLCSAKFPMASQSFFVN